jgi:predicted nucleic acid-binding Zn finger protein
MSYILDTDLVISAKLRQEQYIVTSGDERYTVSLLPGNVFCTCKGFVNRATKTSYVECRHIKYVKSVKENTPN